MGSVTIVVAGVIWLTYIEYLIQSIVKYNELDGEKTVFEVVFDT